MLPKLKTGGMTARQFKQELRQLGFSVYASVDLLGVSLRTAQRYSSGESAVPPTIAKLIRLHAFQRALDHHFSPLTKPSIAA